VAAAPAAQGRWTVRLTTELSKVAQNSRSHANYEVVVLECSFKFAGS
jgi:hypothetical protein